MLDYIYFYLTTFCFLLIRSSSSAILSFIFIEILKGTVLFLCVFFSFRLTSSCFFFYVAPRNRLLAHAKVESVKSKEAAEQRKLKKGGWFSFKWSVESVASF